ncbi:ABC transporter permease [Streptomyces sp. NBC_00859]|uniref:ABC transporter permease n=1 Tax=Streptomyces sp. NBC_00859 TaxID=2903682 RepID=UPI003869A741|nr:ABC transporter permease [Streptomyces sp. NBC_00859]
MSTDTVAAAPAPNIALPHRRLLRRLATRSNVLVSLCLAFLVAVILGAALAPWIAPHDPNSIDFSTALADPSAHRLLGGDISGRDTSSRLLTGARTSLLGPLCVVVLSTAAGLLIGVTAAWRGGAADTLLSRGSELLLAFPGLLLAMLLTALYGRGLLAPVLALSVAYIPYVSRLSRSLALSEMNKPYLAAYTIQGFSGRVVCLRHLMPNIIAVVLAQSAVNFGYALLDLASLSYLGLGTPPLEPDWGSMVNDGQSAILQGSPLSAAVPCLAIVLTVVTFNVVGERVADTVARRS